MNDATRPETGAPEGAEATAAALLAMPRYKCHKEVQAAKIEKIAALASGGLRLFLEGGSAVSVSEEWRNGKKPAAGGYLIAYEDGYTSYSPAKPFEEGYTRKGLEPEDEAGRDEIREKASGLPLAERKRLGMLGMREELRGIMEGLRHNAVNCPPTVEKVSAQFGYFSERIWALLEYTKPGAVDLSDGGETRKRPKLSEMAAGATIEGAGPIFQPGEFVRHVKTRGVYLVESRARLESNEAEVYVYAAFDGTRWVRPVGEMNDGRFERVTMAMAEEEIRRVAESRKLAAELALEKMERQRDFLLELTWLDEPGDPDGRPVGLERMRQTFNAGWERRSVEAQGQEAQKQAQQAAALAQYAAASSGLPMQREAQGQFDPSKGIEQRPGKPIFVPTMFRAPAPGAEVPPYGIPTERPGFVKSPYNFSADDIDVRGFAPGQICHDPTSQKLFRVPPAQDQQAAPGQAAELLKPAKTQANDQRVSYHEARKGSRLQLFVRRHTRWAWAPMVYHVVSRMYERGLLNSYGFHEAMDYARRIVHCTPPKLEGGK